MEQVSPILMLSGSEITATNSGYLTSVTHLCRLPDLPVPYWRDLKGGNTSSAPGGLYGPRPYDKQEMRKKPPGEGFI